MFISIIESILSYRNCTIVQFTGKNFERKPKVFVDQDILNKFKDLDAVAKLCKVRIQVGKSFSLKLNYNSTVPIMDVPFYTGRGIQISQINDLKGKSLCNVACLGSMNKIFFNLNQENKIKRNIFKNKLIKHSITLFNTSLTFKYPNKVYTVNCILFYVKRFLIYCVSIYLFFKICVQLFFTIVYIMTLSIL